MTGGTNQASGKVSRNGSNVGSRRVRRRSRRVLRQGVALMLAAVLLLAYPFAMRAVNRWRHERDAAEVERVSESRATAQRNAVIDAARRYNADLASRPQTVIGDVPGSDDSSGDVSVGSAAANGASTGDVSEGEQSSQSGTVGGSLAAMVQRYRNTLDVIAGVMGTVDIPKIGVRLPIYHGTSQQALARGAGHLFGTSLPVGGSSTHTVVTAHRGLVKDEMFTHLDEMAVGDEFIFRVEGMTLRYRVDRITVIDPDDINDLRIVRGEDRATLMTCTPYGVNTQRLLVSGIRVRSADGAHDDVQEQQAVTRAIGAAAVTAACGTSLAASMMAFQRRNARFVARHANVGARRR